MSTVGPFVSPSDQSPLVSHSAPPVTPSEPSPAPARGSRLAIIREWSTPVAILLLAASIAFYALWSGGRSGPGPVVDGVAAGRSYAPVLVGTYASAWDVAADKLGEGKSVGEAQKVMKDTWNEARRREFVSRVTPVLAQVLPEGQEPRDAAHRREVVQLWRDFAKGLRKGK